MKNKPKAIVVGLGPHGIGVIRSLWMYRIPAIAVSSNFLNASGFTRLCSKVRYPDLYNENLMDFLIGISKKEREKPVLFLTIDENVSMVSKHRDALQRYFHFNLPQKETVDMLLNKKLFADFAKKENFLIPNTYFASNADEIINVSDCITYPCIIKPSFRGAAWEHSGVKKVYRVNDPRELVEQYRAIEYLQNDVIIQEWIPGVDAEVYFCLLYFNKAAKCVAHCVGRKLRQWPPECGSTSLAISCEQEHVLNESIRLFEKVNFRGMGSIEFKLDSRDNKFKITEPTAGRTNLQSAIATACGVNLPYIAYMDILGRDYTVHTKQINGIKWINEYSDMRSSYYYIRHRKLNARQWLNSLKGKKAFAIFYLKDPLPTVVFFIQVAQEFMSKTCEKILYKISIKDIAKALRRENVKSKILNYTGFVYGMSKIKKNRLTILAYHRILNIDHEPFFDFDEGVISATPHDFEAQVKWLKNNFNITTFASLLKGEMAPNSLIITFDDGYKDNYENAYPVLNKYNVPATIFLTTGYIESSRLFWWDEISYLVKKTAKRKLSVNYLGNPITFDLITRNDKKNAISHILKLVKRIPNNDRIDIINRLRIELEVDIDNFSDARMILSWDEIREMSKNGIEFGAHSVTHPVLANATPETVKYEVEESKRKIECEIGKDVTTFSYPVGGSDRFNEQAKRSVENAGYSYAVSYIPGKNTMLNLDKYCLNRIHVEKNESISVFKSKVVFPEFMRY